MRAFVFDAYGTLFDVASIVTTCSEVVSEPEAFAALWRAKQLEYSFLRSLMGRYKDFWQVTEGALRYAAKRHGLTVTPVQEKRLMEAWLYLQPFPEVRETLRRLKGYPRLILSNGSPAMLFPLLENTGLKDDCDAVLSVEAVQIYKPAPQVYDLVLRRLGGAPHDIVFLSSNGFDVAGAKTFGFTVCWVNRTGATLDELDVEPDATVRTLDEIPGVLTATATR
jgi:2-haloacid dehalogenase